MTFYFMPMEKTLLKLCRAKQTQNKPLASTTSVSAAKILNKVKRQNVQPGLAVLPVIYKSPTPEASSPGQAENLAGKGRQPLTKTLALIPRVLFHGKEGSRSCPLLAVIYMRATPKCFCHYTFGTSQNQFHPF